MENRKDYNTVIQDCKKNMQEVMNDIGMSSRGAIEWMIENFNAGISDNHTEKLLFCVHLATLCVRDGQIKESFHKEITKTIDENTFDKMKPTLSDEEIKLISADLDEVKSKIKDLKITY